MAYLAILSDSQQLAIANQNGQTQITSTISSPGQQQSQSGSFTTGEWTERPKLFDVPRGFILQIATQQGSHYIQIDRSGIGNIERPSDLGDYPLVDLKELPHNSAKPMNFEQMPPMQPMKMGDMSMDINSMSMQMGNMSLSFNDRGDTVTQQFCSQCGAEAKAGDRFCRSCGHELIK